MRSKTELLRCVSIVLLFSGCFGPSAAPPASTPPSDSHGSSLEDLLGSADTTFHLLDPPSTDQAPPTKDAPTRTPLKQSEAALVGLEDWVTWTVRLDRSRHAEVISVLLPVEVEVPTPQLHQPPVINWCTFPMIGTIERPGKPAEPLRGPCYQVNFPVVLAGVYNATFTFKPREDLLPEGTLIKVQVASSVVSPHRVHPTVHALSNTTRSEASMTLHRPEAPSESGG